MFDIFYTNTKPNLFPHEQYTLTADTAKEQARTKFFWLVDGRYDMQSFDFTWQPVPWENHQTHIFRCNSQFEEFEVLLIPTHEETIVNHYYDTTYLPRKADPANWKILKTDVAWDIDPTWVPNPYEPPYIYVFGNQWYSSTEMPTAEYHVAGATDYKYVDDLVCTVKANPANWRILKTDVAWDIDPTWAPNPYEPPYIYVFGNQWYSSTEMPTAEYHVAGATDYKYVDDLVCTVKANPANWRILKTDVAWDIDPTWAPNPYEPPYIYVFGNQWYSSTEMPTAEYHVAGATDYKYVDDLVLTISNNKERWYVPEEVDASMIDFDWAPNPDEPPYVYHFSSEFQMSTGLTYTVPGATDIKFETVVPLLVNARKKTVIRLNQKTEHKSGSIVRVVSMFFIDMNNRSSSQRFANLKVRYPNIQKVRYINSWLDTIKRCLTRSETLRFWVISSENIYNNFNFEWHAQPWQSHMTHVFGSQWQKWSDTYLINKNEFQRHITWAKTLEEFPNLNFVSDQPVYRPDDLYDIYFVNHANPGTEANFARIKKRYPLVKTARYVDNYLDTFKRIVTSAETEYIWVTNSISDYNRFDFTWQPDQWQAKMLHVFPSGQQKFGDTFYIHVPTFKQQMDNITQLEQYDTINYCDDQAVLRLPVDVVEYDTDTVVNPIKSHKFTGPYAIFKPKGVTANIDYAPSLWSSKDRVVHTFTRSGSVVIAPREIRGALDTQVYDYPHILPHNDLFLQDKPLDIVYISNGEPDADRWYNHLLRIAPGRTIHHVQNVTGRAAAYKTAATVSTTPWFFTVFAKLEVLPEFDFNWQPDRLQQQKHYIFYATNPVNGLQYGHQAVICYNKELVLQTTDSGLDFTLSKEHEVVPTLSAIAHFNVTKEITWRTAFRECIKLKDSIEKNPTDYNSTYRLETWLTVADGQHAAWSINGAKDAVDYYNSVAGDIDKLMLSYEWKWLDEYFASKY